MKTADAQARGVKVERRVAAVQSARGEGATARVSESL